MTRLNLSSLLLPLLLSACPGKDGLLTDHTTASAGSTSAGTTDETSTDSAGTTTADPSNSNPSFPDPGGTTLDSDPSPSSPSFPDPDGTTLDSDSSPSSPTQPTTDGTSTTDTEDGPDVPEFSSDAALYQACGPADDLITRIEIGITDAVCDATWSGVDKFTITILMSAPVAPGEYTFELPKQAEARVDNGDGTPLFAADGTVTIDTWVGNQVTGSYQIILNDNTHLDGTFTGPYCGGRTGCA